MKLVSAIVRPFKLDEVRKALAVHGIQSFTVSEVRGFGGGKGATEFYRGATYSENCLPKVKIEIVAPDEKIDTIVKTILETAKTGKIGDGKVFVLPVSEAYRIRTDESNEAAV